MTNIEKFKNQLDAVEAFTHMACDKNIDMFTMDRTKLLENFMTWLLAESDGKDLSHVQTPYTEREMRMLHALNHARTSIFRVNTVISSKDDYDDRDSEDELYDIDGVEDDGTVEGLKEKIRLEISGVAGAIDNIFNERMI